MKTQQEYFDVLIVGAGLSGIGAACHLSTECPDRTYIIVESRDTVGGTWDLFRYPGVRSDSDMHTLGYSFRPWEGSKTITDGSSILTYIKKTAKDYNVEKHIRFNHKLVSASWCSQTSQWALELERADRNESVVVRANFLFMCSGYYDYDIPHEPSLPNADCYEGILINPQFWPKDLDYQGKNVVVIGSGATAVTIVPAMAQKANHVTMLQRSPSYFLSWPSEDWFTRLCRKLLPFRAAYSLTRSRFILFQEFIYKSTRIAPSWIKKVLINRVRNELGADHDIDKHFTPRYNPWDQRLCLVPDSDFFKALKENKASVVTDHIRSFTETGIMLESGDRLDADIVVAATGLKLVVMGGARFSVDNRTVDFASLWSYKGLMVSDVPNMVSTFGYVNASWTLRADITAQWVCKTLNHMSRTNTTRVVPRFPNELAGLGSRDWISGFPAGYIKRVMHLFPKQGFKSPWINPQDFRKDKKMFNESLKNDKALHFN